MKTREPRQTIQVTARMRYGDLWQDVEIQNVSAHGMKVAVVMPPRRGSVIEIRRASQIIIARAVWVEKSECGLRTQDVVDVRALLDPMAKRTEAVCRDAQADRRRTPRPEETAARSQWFAMRFQQAAMAAALMCGGVYLAWSVGDVLRAPFASVTAALGGQPLATEGAAVRPLP